MVTTRGGMVLVGVVIILDHPPVHMKTGRTGVDPDRIIIHTEQFIYHEY